MIRKDDVAYNVRFFYLIESGFVVKRGRFLFYTIEHKAVNTGLCFLISMRLIYVKHIIIHKKDLFI